MSTPLCRHLHCSAIDLLCLSISPLRLCIANEVQSGFARTGSNFWGFEGHGVLPDIVTVAKGIGNGIPNGAVITTPEVAQVLSRRSYFNTFGGNPVCTAAEHAVLKVLEKEQLQKNAFVVGSYLKDRLKVLQEKHENVRGRGLMLGIELVSDRKLKTPAIAEIVQIMDQMKEMGVLIGKGGFYGNVFRITPPLSFTKEDFGTFEEGGKASKVVASHSCLYSLSPCWESFLAIL